MNFFTLNTDCFHFTCSRCMIRFKIAPTSIFINNRFSYCLSKIIFLSVIKSCEKCFLSQKIQEKIIFPEFSNDDPTSDESAIGNILLSRSLIYKAPPICTRISLFPNAIVSSVWNYALKNTLNILVNALHCLLLQSFLFIRTRSGFLQIE